MYFTLLTKPLKQNLQYKHDDEVITLYNLRVKIKMYFIHLVKTHVVMVNVQSTRFVQKESNIHLFCKYLNVSNKTMISSA